MIITSWPIQIIAFVRMGRPLFLAGGFLMHALGAAMAFHTGAPLNLPALIWGQAAVTATQLMTHYTNEYFDQAADQLNSTPTTWAGGSRVLPEGTLPASSASITVILTSLLSLAAILGAIAVVRPGPLAAPILLLAAVLAWGYTAPPLRLAYRGWGELTVGVIVTGLTPLAGFYLQAGRLAALPLLAIAPLICLQVASMLTVGLPDAASDAQVGKRTLVVCLGGASAARLHNLLLLTAYALLPLLAWAGLPLPVAIAAGLTAPIAAAQAWRMQRGHGASPACWNSLAFWSIALLISTAGLELLAFLLF